LHFCRTLIGLKAQLTLAQWQRLGFNNYTIQLGALQGQINWLQRLTCPFGALTKYLFEYDIHILFFRGLTFTSPSTPEDALSKTNGV